MSQDPKDNSPITNQSPPQGSSLESVKKSQTPFERSQFGGSQRQPKHHLEDDVPISKRI